MKKKKEKKKYSLFSYLKKHKFCMFAYIFSTAIYYIGNVISTILAAQFLADITDNALNDVFDSALKKLIIIVSIMLVARLFYWFSCKKYFDLMTDVSYEVKKDLIDRSFKLTSKAYSESSAGLLITRITKDPDDAIWKLDRIVDSLSEIISFSVSLIYILFINVWIGLITAATIIGLSFLERYKVKTYMKNKKLEKECSEGVTSITNEIIRSEKDVKCLNLEDNLRKLSDQKFTSYKKTFYKSHFTESCLWNFRRILTIIYAFIVTLVGLFLLRDFYITTAAFLYVYMNRNSLNDVVWNFGNITGALADFKIAETRMMELFDEDKYPSEKFGDKTLNECIGKIEFNNVSFSYENLLSGEGEERKVEVREIFKDLSFSVEPNTTVAFVGKSGSGKSTILNLITKMFPTCGGEILLDGVNIDHLTRNSLRNNISLVNQFPYIYNATITENLLLAKKEATQEEIIDACKRSSLWDFIQSLPRGLDTYVGENGIKLSGGQKQRLAIARALLRNSKVIIFDESTSSLDNLAQQDIKTSIDNLQGGNTVIIVAHRLSTIKNADVIFFLDDGKIHSQGTFEELYEKDEMFRNLFMSENQE